MGDEAYLGASDRWLVHLKVEPTQLIVEVATERGDWTTLAATSLDEASLEQIVAAVARPADVLTVHRLRPGQRYRIVRGFVDVHGDFQKATGGGARRDDCWKLLFSFKSRRSVEKRKQA